MQLLEIDRCMEFLLYKMVSIEKNNKISKHMRIFMFKNVLANALDLFFHAKIGFEQNVSRLLQ